MFTYNTVTNSQYSRGEVIELNPVLEENTCKQGIINITIKRYSWLSVHFPLNEKTEQSIIKLQCCKQEQSIMSKRKTLSTKSQELTQLKFWGRLLVLWEYETTSVLISPYMPYKLRVTGRYILPGFLTML